LWCYLLNNEHYSDSGGRKKSYKSKSKEQQWIFLENGTHTVCQCTDTQVYSYMLNCKDFNNKNMQVSANPYCDLANDTVSNSDYSVTCYGNWYPI
jgi:hypothetical protein